MMKGFICLFSFLFYQKDLLVCAAVFVMSFFVQNMFDCFFKNLCLWFFAINKKGRCSKHAI